VIPNPRLEGKETLTESCDRAVVHPAHPNPTSRAVARNSANATRTTRMSIGELSTPKNTNRKQMWLHAHVALDYISRTCVQIVFKFSQYLSLKPRVCKCISKKLRILIDLKRGTMPISVKKAILH